MELGVPAIVINFKAYEQSFGESCLKLAKICERVANEENVSIAIAPPMTELSYIAKNVALPCFAQHCDALSFGSYTGFTPVEAIKQSGAIGSLINHSEHRLKLADIEYCINKLKEQELTSIVCTNNIATTRAAAALEPSFVAIEPPELIGTGIPVSKAKPEIVSNAVKAVKKISRSVGILTGAGITKGEDVRAAIKLGTDGVLLASGVVKAEDPEKVLKELAAAIE